MQQLLIAVILFCTIAGTTSASPRTAAHKDPTFTGIQAFKEKFPNATNIRCKVKGELTEVNFIWNSMRLQSFFDLEGNLLATCRTISASDLSLTAQMNLKDQYSRYIEQEAIEYNDANSGVSYYVKMVGPKATLLLCVSTDGMISLFKKMKH